MNASTDFLPEARRLEDEGKLELAIGKYKQALELGEGEAGVVHQSIARLLAHLGRFDESTLVCQEALKLDSGLPIAHGVLGTIHYMRKEFAQAEPELLEAVRLKPDYVAALANLAHVYLISGRYQEASATYEKAVTLQPQDYGTRIALAQAYLAQIQLTRALNKLNMARRLKPTALAVYLWYLAVIVQGSLRSFRQWGAIVLVGLLAIALLGPIQVSVPIGALVSAFFVLIWLAALVSQRGQWQSIFRLALYGGLYCMCYWLFVWGHSMYTLRE